MNTPILSDIKAMNAAQNRPAPEKNRGSKNRQRKQRRYKTQATPATTPPTLAKPVVQPRKFVQVVNHPEQLGSYLPNVYLLCGVALVVAVITLLQKR